MTTTPDNTDRLYIARSRTMAEDLASADLLAACAAQGVSIDVDSDAWAVVHADRRCAGRTTAPADDLRALLALAVVGLGIVDADDLATAVSRELDERDPALWGRLYPAIFSALQDGLFA